MKRILFFIAFLFASTFAFGQAGNIVAGQVNTSAYTPLDTGYISLNKLKVNSTIAYFGNSISARGLVGGEPTSKPTYWSALGYATWTQQLTNYKLFAPRFSDSLAISGQTTTQMLARLGAALNYKLDVVVIEAGTNDIATGASSQTIIDNLQNIVNGFVANGTRVYILTVMKRWSPATFTSGQETIRQAVNTAILGMATTMVTPINLENAMNSSTLFGSDGIHPTSTGAYTIATLLAPKIQTYLPTNISITDNIGSDNNLVTNGNLLAGTSGTTTSASGTVVSNFNLNGTNAGGGTITGSVTNANNANQQVITLSGTYTYSASNGCSLYSGLVAASNLYVNDELEGYVDFEITTPLTNVQAIYLQNGIYDGSSTLLASGYTNYYAGDNPIYPLGNGRYQMRTPPITITTGTPTQIDAKITILFNEASGSLGGVVRIWKVGLRKIVNKSYATQFPGLNTNGILHLYGGNGTAYSAPLSSGDLPAGVAFLASAQTFTGLNQFNVTNTATSGSQYGFQINPTYNQASGTGTNTDLLINRTETAIMSGTQLLEDLQVGGTSKFSVSRTGVVTAANTITTPTIQTPAVTTALGSNSSLISLGANGTSVVRNISDANSAFFVNNKLGTGDIQDWQFATSNVATMGYNGKFTLNGSISASSSLAQGIFANHTLTAVANNDVLVEGDFNPTIAGVGIISTLGSVTGGSSYTNGTYTNVPLTGGNGSGAQATVVVSGGAVSTVTITTAGTRYVVGDILSAAAANIGGTGSGFSVPVATLTQTVTGAVLRATVSNIGQGSGSSGSWSDGLLMLNSTAATATLTQNAPGIHFSSYGWNTGSSASQVFDSYIVSSAQTGATSPGGNIGFIFYQNGTKSGTSFAFAPSLASFTSAQLQLTHSAQGATVFTSLALLNTTASTVGTPNQWTNQYYQEGTVWNTGGTPANNPFAFGLIGEGTSSANPYASWYFQTYLGTSNTPTFVNMASFTTQGQFNLALANSNVQAGSQAGTIFNIAASTVTDNSTASGTVTNFAVIGTGLTTLAATNASITYTNGYGAFFTQPTNGTNVTMTNKYALGLAYDATHLATFAVSSAGLLTINATSTITITPATTFSTTVSGPTASTLTNTTQLATTAYVINNVLTKRTAQAINATATATAAQMAAGYITSTSAAATTITFQTATAYATGLGAAAGSTADLYIDNTAGANTVTIVLGSGMTGVNSPSLTVSTGASGIALYHFTFSSTSACTVVRLQ